MTALPKRKPARRPAMAKPEPEPRPVLSWAELTAPLQHYEFPVWPQAWWTASDAYRDEQRRHDGDPWQVYALTVEARENTNRLAAAGVSMAGYDGTLSDEARAVLPEDAQIAGPLLDWLRQDAPLELLP